VRHGRSVRHNRRQVTAPLVAAELRAASSEIRSGLILVDDLARRHRSCRSLKRVEYIQVVLLALVQHFPSDSHVHNILRPVDSEVARLGANFMALEQVTDRLPDAAQDRSPCCSPPTAGMIRDRIIAPSPLRHRRGAG
jgi:hypothetical protein